jgi:hypothetical protein
MNRFNKLLIPLPAIVLLFFATGVAPAAPNGLLKTLQQFDRNVCKSMSLTCKTKPKSKVQSKRKQVKESPAPKVARAPKPESKPEPRIGQAPVPKPVAKPVVSAKAGKPEPEPELKQEPVPKPEAKPVTSVKNAKPELPNSTLKLDDVLIEPPRKTAIVVPPLPRPKPLNVQAAITPVVIPKVDPPPAPQPGLADESCLKELSAQGADFTVATNVADKGACHVQNPVHLNSVKLKSGEIALPETPLLNCRYALQFSKWLAVSATPIISAQGFSPLEKISTGPGFECRGRNGDVSSKLSEHGRGNAVDITTFTLRDDKILTVADASVTASSSRNVLAALRSSACGYFTTVLGPGSNAAHASHFHFDLGTHGKSGTYRICE